MKIWFYVVSVFLLIFVSCSNPENLSTENSLDETLKSLVSVKTEAAVWTSEIEGDRLTAEYSRKDFIDQNVKVSTETVKVSSFIEDPVYPILSGFGSLDVSGIPVSTLDTVKNFCTDISKNIFSGESYFDKSSLFSFVFFIDDLEKSFFETKILEPEEESKNLFFDSFICGKAFYSENQMQVPVRFYKDKNILDVLLFVSSESNKISQIKITGMEKEDGKN